MNFDISDIAFLVVVLSIALLLINSDGGGGHPARASARWSQARFAVTWRST